MFDRLRDSLHAAAWVALSTLAPSSAMAQCGLGGDCGSTNTAGGCADMECCEAVCAIDPFCCSTAWDGLCVQAAQNGCDSCGGTPLIVAAFGGSVTLPGGVAIKGTDLAAFDPTTGTWSLYFEGADVGLTKTISAATQLPDGDLVLSTTSNGSISGMAGTSSFTRNDLIRFTPTSLGADTAGSWTFYLDGSDVGLSTSGLSINSASVLPDGSIVIGTTSGGDIPGVGFVAPHDLVLFTPASLGTGTTGSWSLYFDGSDMGLSANGNKLDSASVRQDGSILLSTNSTSSFQGFKAKSDLVLFEPTSLGDSTSGTLSYYIQAYEMGLDSTPNIRGSFLADVSRSSGDARDGGGDGGGGPPPAGCGSGGDCCAEGDGPGCADASCCQQICELDPYCCEVRWDQYCVMAATFHCESCMPGPKVVVTFGSSTTLPNGITAEPCDLVQFDLETGEWSMYFRGANVGLAGRAIGGATVMPDGDLLIALTSSSTLEGLTGAPSGTSYTRNDILRFTPTLLGEETSGSWTFFMDGSDVGLDSSYLAIRALALLDDGGIVIGCNTGGSLPGVGQFTGHDLVVFDPTSLGASTSGAFSPYFRGGDVGLSTNGERLDFAFVNADGMLLLSTRSGFSVTGNVSGLKSDLLAFFPDSLGDNTSGDFTMFMTGTAAGLSTSADVRGGFVLYPVVPLIPRPDPGGGGDSGGGGGGGGGGGDSGGGGGNGGDGPAAPEFCGDPIAGNCCSVSDTPFCNDADCCDAVCLIDASCCSIAWDQACATIASSTCAPCSNASSVAWTDFTQYLTASSRIMYVAADGDDSTAIAYSPNTAVIGSDPMNPAGPVLAFRTYEAARALMRDYEADWVLFRRGDSFTLDNGLFSHGTHFFFSHDPAGAPIRKLIGSYGPETQPRPILTVAPTAFKQSVIQSFAVGTTQYGNTAFVSLDLRAPGVGDGEHACISVAGQSNLHFEDCRIRGSCEFIAYQWSGDPEKRLCRNITMRRCAIVDAARASGGHTQGLFVSEVVGLVLEECVLDRNGYVQNPTDPSTWTAQLRTDNSNSTATPAGQGVQPHRTWFSRNFYGAAYSGLFIRGCILSRSGSSHQMRVGGVAERNVFIWNDSALSAIVQAQRDPWLSGQTLSENLVLHDDHLLCQSESGVGLVASVGEGFKAIVHDNIVAHFCREAKVAFRCLGIPSYSTAPAEVGDQATLTSNVGYLESGTAFNLRGTTGVWSNGFASYIGSGNAAAFGSAGIGVATTEFSAPASWSFGANHFAGAQFQTGQPYDVQTHTLGGWQSLGFDGGSSAYASTLELATTLGWQTSVDAQGRRGWERDIVSYMQSIDPGYSPDENVTVDDGVPASNRRFDAPKVWEVLAGLSAASNSGIMSEADAKLTARRYHAFLTFIERARENRKGSWSHLYTADALNSYIRSGFGKAAVFGQFDAVLPEFAP